MRERLVVVALLGAGLFVALELLFVATWELWFQPARIEAPWFLGSRKAVIVTQTSFGLASLALGLGARWPWRRRLEAGSTFAVGAVVAMVVVFSLLGAERLLLGPTRLWPIALAAGATILALPVLAGTLAAGLLSGKA